MATWQVNAGGDNCRRRLVTSLWDSALTGIPAGAYAYGTTYYKYGGGMRFTSITIPKGATITEAHLTLRCTAPTAGVVCRTRISAEDVDDASSFLYDDAAIFDARWANRTTARVDWDAIPAWEIDTDYDSPDIKTVIQEIVDRAGWASGQDILIFWEDFDDRSDHNTDCLRYAVSYYVNPTYAPKLVITYIEIVAPTVTTNPATSVGQTTATKNGTLDDDGGEVCEVRFQYGETTDYGTNTEWQPGKTTGDTFEQEVRALLPGRVYHFRAQARNSAGTANGADRTFHTLALSAAAHEALGKSHPLGRAEL